MREPGGWGVATTPSGESLPCGAMTPFSPLLVPPADDVTEHLWFSVRANVVAVGPEPFGDPVVTHFLGMRGSVACWAADLGEEPPGRAEAGVFTDLRRLWGMLDETDFTVAGRAVQLVEWRRTHRFCGRCGAPTELAEGERAMRCPNCRLLSFPRLAPAIITLVTRNDGREALLARGVTFPVPMYSCLAGFVEPGENLEQAVAREVLEEVGIRVRDVAYRGSQPWPFPHSLMLGFRAEWAEGDIVCDPKEIVDANWYRADDLPSIPPGISIARRLIDQWVAEQADRG